jgi:2-polyprenyl-3-methyl-5-hydroxy-6-metoxy-1,4-benzoquinol methylase
MVKFLNMPTMDSDAEEIMNSINDFVLFNKKGKFSFDDAAYNSKSSLEKSRTNLFTVNQTYNISTYQNILSMRKRFNKPIVFVKKVIRKMIRWYVDGIVTQQVNFNGNVTRYLNEEYYLLQYLYNQNNELKEKISELESKLEEQNHSHDDFYLDFENKFRGDTEQITKRQTFYLPHFIGRKKVIDIGCGRGEFLQLMQDNKISAIGVDTNVKMIELCKSKNLNVINDEGIHYLLTIPDDSVDGIFASQVVEHLSFEEMEKLVEVAYQKLKVGGCFVLETINPLTLGVYCYSFYMDPTHVKPVHPATLRFILERIGFDVKPIQFLNHFTDEYKLIELDTMDEIQKKNIEKLNNILFDAQDYAIICEKRKDSNT